MTQYESLEEAKTATYELNNVDSSNLFHSSKNESFIKLNNGRDNKFYSADEIREDTDSIIKNNNLSMECESKLLDIQSFLQNIHKEKYNIDFYEVGIVEEDGCPVNVVVPLSECEHISEDHHVAEMQEENEDGGYKIKDDFVDKISGTSIDLIDWYVRSDQRKCYYHIYKSKYESVEKVDESFLKLSILGVYVPTFIITVLIGIFIVEFIFSLLVSIIGFSVANFLVKKLRNYYTYTEPEEILMEIHKNKF